MRRPRRNHSPQFKAKVATAVLRSDKTLAELAELAWQHDMRPSQIHAVEAAGAGEHRRRVRPQRRRTSLRTRAQGTAREDWTVDTGERFSIQRVQQSSAAERKAMIERDHRLSVTRQCQLLSLPRSSFYHKAQPTPDPEFELMRELDELHLQLPWMGSRSLRDQLQLRGFALSRDRVRRLMRKIRIQAICRKARTRIPEKGHKICPYLLGGLSIERSSQV